MDVEKLPVYGILDEKYQLSRQLGEGGTSIVYEGADLTGKISKIPVAVKIFNNKLVGQAETFQNEVQLMATLKNPRCVNILDFNGDSTLVLYNKKVIPKTMSIVMEYMKGGVFIDYLMLGGLDEVIARTYFHHLIEGLEFIHQKGYAHRDIKPENTFLDGEFRIRFGDFGFAGLLEGKHSDDLMFTKLGTETYMAPEVFIDKEVKKGYDGKAADIFSLGVTLFTMVTGKPPFMRSHPTFKVLENKLYEKNEEFWKTYINHFEKTKSKVNLNQEFQALINGMLNRDPKLRFNIEAIKKTAWYLGKTCSEEDIFQYMAMRCDNTEITTGFTRSGGANRGDPVTINDRTFEFDELDDNPEFDFTFNRKLINQDKTDITDIIIDIEPLDMLKILILLAPELQATVQLHDENYELEYIFESGSSSTKLQIEVSTLSKNQQKSVISAQLLSGNKNDRLMVVGNLREILTVN